MGQPIAWCPFGWTPRLSRTAVEQNARVAGRHQTYPLRYLRWTCGGKVRLMGSMYPWMIVD